MAVTITITTAGSSISDPLAVYTSPNNITWTFDANVAKATLLTGYTFTPPVGTYYYQVRDLGTCESILSLNCTTTTTTTAAPTTTTTTTIAPTTTTTTTGTPTTTTTTTLPTFYEYQYGFGASIAEACGNYFGSGIIVWSTSSSFVTGMALYYYANFDNPISGYAYLSDGSDSSFVSGNIVGVSAGACP
jgi:hypothetical protein